MDKNYIFVLSANTYDWDIDIITTSEQKAVEYAMVNNVNITVFKDGREEEIKEFYINASHYSRENEILFCDQLGLPRIKEALTEKQKLYNEKNKAKKEADKQRELKELARLKAKYEIK